MQLKKLSLIALSALTVLSLISTGCKKSSDSNSASFSATVGSSGYSSSTTVGVYDSYSTLLGIISYSIANKDTTAFSLTLPLNVKVGKAFSSDSTLLEVMYQAPNGHAYDSWYGHAVATVNSLDSTGHKISGVFNAVAYNGSTDSVVITNGKFNTSYTVQ